MSTDTAAPPDPAQHVIQIATGYMLSSAFYTAVKLGIPDRLADGPKTAGELARAAGAHEDALYRIMRSLSMVGIFDEIAPRRFALTPASELLRTGVSGNMRDMAEFLTEPTHFRVYAELLHSVKTGQPAADKVLGAPVFEYFPRDPDLSRLFNDAMTNFSALVIPAALDAYDFSGIDLLVDVAGGHGEVLTSILKRYPSMRGILTDLGHVIEGARPRIATLGLADRIDAVDVDIFKAVPAGGDAYIMKHIIHDWDDDRALTILRNIHTAQGGRKDGRVILLESVIAPGNQPDFGKVIDIEMLAFPGGRERTAEEFTALFDRAGYELTRIVPTKSPLSVIEARRRSSIASGTGEP